MPRGSRSIGLGAIAERMARGRARASPKMRARVARCAQPRRPPPGSTIFVTRLHGWSATEPSNATPVLTSSRVVLSMSPHIRCSSTSLPSLDAGCTVRSAGSRASCQATASVSWRSRGAADRVSAARRRSRERLPVTGRAEGAGCGATRDVRRLVERCRVRHAKAASAARSARSNGARSSWAHGSSTASRCSSARCPASSMDAPRAAANHHRVRSVATTCGSGETKRGLPSVLKDERVLQVSR